MRAAAVFLAGGVLLAACGGGGSSTAAPDTDDRVSPPPPVVAGSEAVANPGPTSTEGLVPVGFAHSRDGAVAAATSYLSTLHQFVARAPDERRAALDTIAADGADALVDDALAAFEVFDDIVVDARASLPEARVLLREVPVAYTLTQYTDDRARVEVWSLGLLVVESVTQATEVWSTNEVELVWTGDDWRVWSWRRSPGPQPAVGAVDATSATEVLDAVADWEGFRYVPDAS